MKRQRTVPGRDGVAERGVRETSRVDRDVRRRKGIDADSRALGESLREALIGRRIRR